MLLIETKGGSAMLTLKAVVLGLVLLIANPALSIAQSPLTGETEFAINSGGLTRQYLLYMPPQYDSKIPLPLLLFFHGTGGNYKAVISTTGFGTIADRERFIIAIPKGIYQFTGRDSWNADPDPAGVNDINFVRDLIREIDSKVSIDKKRVYAAGYSGGARMSCRLACEMPDALAGIGAVAALQFPVDCKRERPVAIIAFHGTGDVYYGIKQVEPAVAQWVVHNGCNQTPTTTKVSEAVSRDNYDGCKGNSAVIFYRIEGGGHVWPGTPFPERYEKMGLGKVTKDIDASYLISEFMKSYTLP
jgi:polyhydroxybutyrate depolymerase